METRTITQVLIYKLVVNNIQNRAESCTLKAIAYEYDKLIAWYQEQLATEPFTDEEKWHRTFKQDSPLYWFNPINFFGIDEPGNFGQGIYTEWVSESIDLELNIPNHITVIK